MKLTKLCSLFAAALLLSAPAQAQSDVTTLPNRLNHKAKIIKSYDKFEDMTMLAVEWMKVAGTETNGLSIQFIAGTKGKIFKEAPPIIGIGIMALTRAPVEAKDAHLFAIVDGTPGTLGEMKFSSRSYEAPLYMVSYSLLLPFGKVAKLATADKVEMRFDGIEFELTDEHRRALLEFLTYARGM